MEPSCSRSSKRGRGEALLSGCSALCLDKDAGPVLALKTPPRSLIQSSEDALKVGSICYESCPECLALSPVDRQALCPILNLCSMSSCNQIH